MEALAQRAGVSSATVYRAEHALHQTTDETWEALADALGVFVDEIHEPEGDITSAAQAENPPNPPDGARREPQAEIAATGATGGGLHPAGPAHGTAA